MRGIRESEKKIGKLLANIPVLDKLPVLPATAATNQPTNTHTHTETMTVVLLHSHYDSEHLADVTRQMRELGAPSIRGIHDIINGMFIALEGCHRVRAAKDLGLAPELVDVGIYDEDGYIDRVSMAELTINSLTSDDNVIDDPESTVGDHLDYVGRAFGLAIIDLEDEP
jgi:hypothetical protein